MMDKPLIILNLPLNCPFICCLGMPSYAFDFTLNWHGGLLEVGDIRGNRSGGTIVNWSCWPSLSN